MILLLFNWFVDVVQRIGSGFFFKNVVGDYIKMMKKLKEEDEELDKELSVDDSL